MESVAIAVELVCNVLSIYCLKHKRVVCVTFMDKALLAPGTVEVTDTNLRQFTPSSWSAAFWCAVVIVLSSWALPSALQMV